MLSTFLDPTTLFALFDAPGEAVRETIERDGWGGMLWPGHEDWVDPAGLHPEDMRAGEQLLSLALHYFTTRHLDAGAIQICTAAQVLCRYATPFLGGYPVEESEVYERADAWVLALAGGSPPAPGGIMALTPPYDAHGHAIPTCVGRVDGQLSLTPPYDAHGHAILPGGDRAAFTRAMVPIIDALVFDSERDAQRLAEQFLRQAGDPEAQRAADIFRQCVLGARLDLDATISCADCGAADLDLWYSGQTWGETLCEGCYQRRVPTGQARRLEA